MTANCPFVGFPRASESDPERALRTALFLKRAISSFAREVGEEKRIAFKAGVEAGKALFVGYHRTTEIASGGPMCDLRWKKGVESVIPDIGA